MFPHPVPLLPLGRVSGRGQLGDFHPPKGHALGHAPCPRRLIETAARLFLPHPRHRNCTLGLRTLAAGPQSGRQQRDVMAGGAIDFSDLPPVGLSLTLSCNLSEKRRKRDTLSHQ
jgi:hypothetical protein